MNEAELSKPTKSRSFVRRILRKTTPPLMLFSLGLVPMWLKARQSTSHLAELSQQVTLAKIQNHLASAVIYAERGAYEQALTEASGFFTTLSMEIAKKPASAFSVTEIDRLLLLFIDRDDMIMLLARGDPSSAKRLSDLYVAYRQIVL